MLKADKEPVQFIEALPKKQAQINDTGIILQISLANGARIGVTSKASSKVINQVLNLAGHMS